MTVAPISRVASRSGVTRLAEPAAARTYARSATSGVEAGGSHASLSQSLTVEQSARGSLFGCCGMTGGIASLLSPSGGFSAGHGGPKRPVPNEVGQVWWLTRCGGYRSGWRLLPEHRCALSMSAMTWVRADGVF